MSQFNIKFYTDSDGKCDFFDYYQKIKLEKERGNKNSRIFIYRRNNIYYVLNYFWKKQSKTPKKEIWKAEKLIEDIESRLGG